MKRPRPLVSVVMAVHDGERFVQQAVQSVLAQTLADLELVVVDDASADATADRLAAVRDPRLRVVRLERNVGPFAAANVGLELARGELVARLDADDLCAPERLATQVAFLARHPKVGLLGSACERVDAAGRSLGLQQVPCSELAVRLRCLVAPPFVHSTVTWRARLGLRYDERYRVAGDYELWARAVEQTGVANLALPLVKYRVWGGGITATRGARQRALHDDISSAYLARQFPRLGRCREAHRALRRWAGRSTPRTSLPRPAEELVQALRDAALPLRASAAQARTFHHALRARVGEWGQPLSHAG